MTTDAEYARAWKKRNPEKNRASAMRYYYRHREELAEFRKNNPDIIKQRNLWHKYGMTKEEYDILYEQQGGRCAICKAEDWAGFGPGVDHDHKTGKVRGILSKHCNLAIGYLKDNPLLADAAANYLRERNHNGRDN